MTELAWATDKKYFTLTVWADVPRGNASGKKDENTGTDRVMTEETMVSIANKLN